MLHFLIGVTGLLGGGLLVVWAVSRASFHDFLIPGVVLYGAVGVQNVIACCLVARREQGAERLSFLAGATLMIWLVAETALVGASPWLQLGYGVAALLVVLDAAWIRRTLQAPMMPLLAR